jgi:hypothetical protein
MESEELKGGHRVSRMEVFMTRRAEEAFAAVFSAFKDQYRPGNQGWR